MKFDYNFDKTLSNDALRDVFAAMGKKDKTTKLPRFVPENYEHSLLVLENLSNLFGGINEKLLDSFRKYPRGDFFDFDSLDDEMKAKFANNPDVFMAMPFYKNNTISSLHNLYLRGSLLDLKPGQRVYEIGAKSGYDCMVFANAMDCKGEVIGFEPDLKMSEIARENIRKESLENMITIVSGDSPSDAEGVFDRISSPYVLRTTKGVEDVLSLLDEGGMARLSIAMIGNVKKKSDAIYWEPGMDLELEDIHIKPNDSRNMVRATTYVFVKEGDNIRGAFNNTGGLSPLAYWE